MYFGAKDKRNTCTYADFREGVLSKLRAYSFRVLCNLQTCRCDATIKISQLILEGKMARTSTLQAGGITEAKVLDPYDPLAASRTSISVSGDVDIYMKTHSTAHARCGSYSICWFQYFLHIQCKVREKVSGHT